MNIVVDQQVINDFLTRLLDGLEWKTSINRLGALELFVVVKEKDQKEALEEKIREELLNHFSYNTLIADKKELIPLSKVTLLTKKEASSDPFYHQVLKNGLPAQSRNLLSWFPEQNDQSEEDHIPVSVFYSYKGGVGRSSSLAFAAAEIARKGHNVAVLDLDLEAPGLHSIFNTTPTYGVTDYMIQCPFLKKDARKMLVREMAAPINGEMTAHNGTVYVIPAGNVSKNYIKKLSHIDPAYDHVMKEKHKASVLQSLLRDIRDTLQVDKIFIDSRTGFAEMGGSLLFDYADEICFVFNHNEQNYQGLKAVFSHFEDVVKNRDSLPNIVWIHNRIPLGEDYTDEYRKTAKTEIENIWDEISADITEDASFQYQEIYYNKAFERFSTSLFLNKLIRSDYEQLSSLLVPEAQKTASETNAERYTPSVPDKLLNMGTGKAEDDFRTEEDIKKNFFFSKSMRELLSPEKYFVTGEKGTGKTSLFLILSKQNQQDYIDAYGKDATFNQSELYELSLSMGDYNSAIYWTRFWMFYCCFVYYKDHFPENEFTKEITSLFKNKDLNALSAKMKDYQYEKNAVDTLTSLSNQMQNEKRNLTFVYDYLDKHMDFPAAPNLRNYINAGLIRFWEMMRIRTPGLRAKVFFRSDLFEDAKKQMENRTHLNEYKVDIQWRDTSVMAMFLKRIISRLSEKDRLFIQEKWKKNGDSSLNLWEETQFGIQPFENDATLDFIFNLLFGKRMSKNAKAGLTKTWLLNRLKDANGNFYPRALIVMAQEMFERFEQIGASKKDPYPVMFPFAAFSTQDRNNIMNKIAETRWSDLVEEYPQVANYVNKLVAAGKPFPIQHALLINILDEKNGTYNF